MSISITFDSSHTAANALPIDWAAYFEHNAAHQRPIDWADSYRLTDIERDTILRSIQQFQVGENSDGRQLMARARRYADRTGDHAYVPALALFIAEEQRHSQYLERFMHQQRLPLAEGHWVDSAFRRIRHLANLELSIAVLLMAEVIAMTYYHALRRATHSQTLRGICRQLLSDEVQHLAFQAETLGKLRRNRPAGPSAAVRAAERVLFAGILAVVWHGHRKVYRAGGYDARRFFAANWRRFERTFRGASTLYTRPRP